MPIILAIILVLSFYMLIDTRSAVKSEYENYLAEARKYAEMGIQIDAAENYGKALAINDTLEINLEVGQFYLEMDDIVSAIEWGNMMIDKYPKEVKAYEYLLNIVYENKDFHRCYSLLETIQKRKLTSDRVKEIQKAIKYEYYLEDGFDSVGAFASSRWPVMIENKWGFCSSTGKNVIKRTYESVGPFSNDIAPVKTFEGETYYIDVDGNKKVVIQNVKNVVELGTFASSLYPVYNGKTWAFYNTDYKKVGKDYEDVSAMGNGIAAVKEGGYYYLVDTKCEKVCNTKFSEVVRDEKNIVCRNDALFVNIDGLYYLVNKKGEKITKTAFQDARLFLDDTYAAVKGDKGWYFIDATGKAVFENLYFDDARSFSNGLAAVKGKGKWGYINLDGKIAIDYTFEDVKDFADNGATFVKAEDIWQHLYLYSENFED